MSAISRALFAIALFIVPERRKDWIEAMAAEFAQVPSGQKIPFALGIAQFTYTAVMEEMMINKISAGSFVIMLGSAFLAFVGLSNALRNFAQDPTVSLAFGMMGALWLAVFVTAMLRQWDWLTRIALGGLSASVALGVAWTMSVPAIEANRQLLGALSLEAVFLFTILLGTGWFVRKLAAADPS